jgi:hypothetical protein
MALDVTSIISGWAARRQQVRDRPGVVAQHVALAHAIAAFVDDDDAARFEGVGGHRQHFVGGGHAQVGVDGAQLVERGIQA